MKQKLHTTKTIKTFKCLTQSPLLLKNFVEFYCFMGFADVINAHRDTAGFMFSIFFKQIWQTQSATGNYQWSGRIWWYRNAFEAKSRAKPFTWKSGWWESVYHCQHVGAFFVVGRNEKPRVNSSGESRRRGFTPSNVDLTLRRCHHSQASAVSEMTPLSVFLVSKRWTKRFLRTQGGFRLTLQRNMKTNGLEYEAFQLREVLIKSHSALFVRCSSGIYNMTLFA